MWFPIPGMYGGFKRELLRDGEHAMLQADRWCRVASGYEERHLISARGVVMQDDTFAAPAL